jgi:SAM-dependent methyltransferase
MKRCLRCDTTFESADWGCPACGQRPDDGDFLSFVGASEASEFPESSFDLLAGLEQNSFWFRARNTIVLAAIRRFAPEPRSFFELGCGTGFVLQAVSRTYPQARVVAGEPAGEGLKIARERVPTATLIQVDGRQIPYRDEFDLIGAFDVLEHVDEDEAVLAELRAALAPGGSIVLTVPQHPWLWSAADDFGRHKRRYTRTELVDKLRRGGLQVAYVTSFMMTLLPLMALSRRRQKDLSRFDPAQELRIPPRIDRLLERIVGMERHAVQRGISLPAGGSLLAVARRAQAS